ncbi:lysophospholipid acyltransferase family protein [Nocardioides pacificus]
MRVRKLEGRRGWAFALGAVILKPTFLATTRHTWIDGEKIPESGGCIVVLNHLSHIDPLISAHVLYDHGRLPHYLAKSGLFRNRFLRRFLTAAGQIPVDRLTPTAVGAYDAALREVAAGTCVVVYPEGTLTRDPDLWPMVGKTGAARIALETGVPVIPVAHWGAQQLLAPYAKVPRPFPRKHITVKVGDPVLLDDLRAVPRSATTIRAATERIMDAITGLLEEIRDETAPAERFDPRKAGMRQIGNPHRKDR